MEDFSFGAVLRMCSDRGITAIVSPYGAALTALYAPDKDGQVENIVYHNPAAFSGAVVAPVAGRIRDGMVTIMGKRFQMPCNEPRACCHSGSQTTGQRLWNVVYASDSQVVFTLDLLDGECGLPGNRRLLATYTLRENRLHLSLQVRTDRTTFVNPTSHIYWNLSGKLDAPAHGQELQVDSSQVWYNDGDHLPIALRDTAGTAFDFRTFRPWDQNLDDPQLQIAYGYNHAFVLSQGGKIQLRHLPSGRLLTMTPSSTHVVFYSGGYLPVPGCGLALEPQLMPDAPHWMGNSLPLLRPAQTFHWECDFKFNLV